MKFSAVWAQDSPVCWYNLAFDWKRFLKQMPLCAQPSAKRYLFCTAKRGEYAVTTIEACEKHPSLRAYKSMSTFCPLPHRFQTCLTYFKRHIENTREMKIPAKHWVIQYSSGYFSGAIVYNGFDKNTLKHRQEHTFSAIATLENSMVRTKIKIYENTMEKSLFEQIGGRYPMQGDYSPMHRWLKKTILSHVLICLRRKKHQ